MADDRDHVRDRFAKLAETYGADLRRWPAGDQNAAENLLASDEVRTILAHEEQLDARLDTYSVPGPSAALIGRILAAAPQPRLLWSRVRLWWSVGLLLSAGLAGGVSGALVFSLATPALLDHPAANWAAAQTIFGAIDLEGLVYE
jgi:hypothetical protein